MSRNRKKDKMYMSAKEWQEIGGKKIEIEKRPFKRLPFDYCALSLCPVKDPVCAPDGTVFDILNIIPYIQKYKIHPVTGKPLKISDLFKIHFHRNQEGKIHCPITYKVFTEHTHIVAIRTSGNVYSYDAVEKMNLQMNNMKDLLTNEPFTKEDIITIQDPKDLEKKNFANFHHLKHNLTIDDAEREKMKDPTYNINVIGATERIFKQMKEKEEEEKKKKMSKTVPQRVTTEEPVKEKKKRESKILYSSTPTGPNSMSASFTSTAMPVIYKQTETGLSEENRRELQYHYIRKKKKKAMVTLHTNMGDLHFELFCFWTPKTCENFVTHCEKGYYDNCIFHRLIPDFMIQGGDPTGTGRGGKSIWKVPFNDEFHPKLRHDDAGILSMANSGKNTNGSQFFITFKAQPHLDDKHTVFGKLVGGMEVLRNMEQVPTGENDRPLTPIYIIKTTVHVNPYKDPLPQEIKIEKKKEDYEIGQWFSNPSPKIETNKTGVGKYISDDLFNKRKLPAETPVIQKNIKKRRMNTFDFSNW